MKDKRRLKTQTAENTKLSEPLSALAMRKVFFLFYLLFQLKTANPIFYVPIMKVKVIYFFLFLFCFVFFNSSYSYFFYMVFCVVFPKRLSDIL